MNSELVKQVGDRKARLRLAYLASKERFPGVSFELFCKIFLFWEILPIVRKGLYIGVVFQKEDEVHIAILPDYRKKWAGKWLGPLIKSCMKNGVVYTQVPLGDKVRLQLAKRLGWRILESQGKAIKLIMTMEDYNNVWNKIKT